MYKKSILSIFIIVIFVVVGMFNILYLISVEKDGIMAINIAGQQRMLSQKLYIDILERDEVAINSGVKRFEHNYKYIRLNIPDDIKYRDELIRHYIVFVKNRDIGNVHKNKNIVLSEFNNIVEELENYYTKKVDILRVLIVVILLIIILVILIVYFTILHPSIKIQEEYIKKLKTSEDQLDAITNNTDAVIFMMNMNREYTFVNKKFCDSIKLSPNDIIGKTNIEIFGGDVSREFDQNNELAFNSGSIVIEENYGDRVYLSNKFLINDFMCGICSDISDRVKFHEEMQRTKRYLEQAQHIAKIGSWILTIKTGEFEWSNEIFNIFQANIYTYNDFLSYVYKDDLENLIYTIDNAIIDENGFDIEYKMLINNKLKYIHMIAEFNHHKLVGTIQDVTEKVMISNKLREYVNIIDKNIITSQTDIYGNIIYVSDAFCQISGYSKEELIGRNHRIIRDPSMPEKLYDEMWTTISSGNIWKGEIRNRAKDGHFYWVYATISPNLNIEGKIVAFTAIRIDITDKKEIERISITDELTSLYNRRYFNKIFGEMSGKFIFGIMDIDNFKKYNDTYGHSMGDEVIRKVASVLKKYSNLSFRLGGEEFGVIVDSVDILENIRFGIEELNIEHINNIPYNIVTISIGCKIVDDDNISLDNIYIEADRLLYQSKAGGRNRLTKSS